MDSCFTSEQSEACAFQGHSLCCTDQKAQPIPTCALQATFSSLCPFFLLSIVLILWAEAFGHLLQEPFPSQKPQVLSEVMSIA